MRVTVLTGGASAERAVAFAGAAQIVEALRGRGHGVTAVDTVTGLLDTADERRLLTTAVGREPPAVAELDERERAMLSNGLASHRRREQASLVGGAEQAGHRVHGRHAVPPPPQRFDDLRRAGEGDGALGGRAAREHCHPHQRIPASWCSTS